MPENYELFRHLIIKTFTQHYTKQETGEMAVCVLAVRSLASAAHRVKPWFKMSGAGSNGCTGLKITVRTLTSLCCQYQDLELSQFLLYSPKSQLCLGGLNILLR